MLGRSGKSFFSKPTKKRRVTRAKPRTKVDYQQNRQIKKLWKAVKGEVKVHQFAPTAFAIVPAGDVRLLSQVPTGNVQGTRNGDQIFARTLRFRAFTQFNPANASQRQTYRIVIFQFFRPPNGGFPAPGDILQLTGAAKSVISPKSIDGYTESKFLYDKTFHLGNPQMGSSFNSNIPSSRLHDVRIKLNKPIVFDKDSGTGTNIVKNGIYCLLISDGTNGADIEMYSVLSYSDN